MSQCKSCGAEIIWAKTPAGKNMPLNADGEKRFLVEGGATQIITCRPIVVRTSHFSTCPNADQHRRLRTT